ncbi:hypothetical protein INR49_005064 [Caranx melampygus]|nr:hypothetical protein INR49_005064 [Caranx melampygus]
MSELVLGGFYAAAVARAQQATRRCRPPGTAAVQGLSDRLSRNESTSSLDRNDTLLAVAMLYEQILAENEKLKAQLRDTDLELADLKLQLEKATQRQERYADRSQLEMEKRASSQNLPQVKQVQALRQVKERLQAENRALALRLQPAAQRRPLSHVRLSTTISPSSSSSFFFFFTFSPPNPISSHAPFALCPASIDRQVPSRPSTTTTTTTTRLTLSFYSA